MGACKRARYGLRRSPRSPLGALRRLPWASPTLEPLDDEVENGREEDSEERDPEHAAEHIVICVMEKLGLAWNVVRERQSNGTQS
jgi:hypothetical protein